MAANYAVAPGEYLREWIEESGSGISQQALADRMGVSRKLVNGILCGRDPITEETAIKLERVTGIPRDAWSRFEGKYREDLARTRDEEELANHIGEVGAKLGNYLRKIGATSATRRNPGRMVADLLGFLGFGSYEAYEDARDSLRTCVATLRESNRKLDAASLMVWKAAGERTDRMLRARSLAYSETALRALIPRLRERTALSDDSMISDVQEMLEGVGVIYQFVSAPDGFPLHGITWWTDGGVPVIQQTGRRKKDGYLIWTLFHEIGHILSDGNHVMRVDSDEVGSSRNPDEKAANSFAKETLFGPSGLRSFYGLRTSESIRGTAEKTGVCPGVAVVEMHRKRMLDYRYGNDLLSDIEIPLES